jgi:hypothetical protein
MHYNTVKQVKCEYSCIYIVKLIDLKTLKKMEHNMKYVMPANGHDQYKEIPQWNKRHY